MGQGGDGGGAPESSVGATRRSLVPPFKPNNWSDLAGDGARGGRWWGAPESSVGATRRSLVPPFGLLKNLTIWLVTRGGGVGGVGQGGGQGGLDGGRHQRVGATRRSLVSPFGLP